MAIKSFKCSETETLHNHQRVARFVNIEASARRKLVQLDAAATLDFFEDITWQSSRGAQSQ